MTVQIRRAGIGDVQAISAVCSAGWRDAYRDIYSKAYSDWVVAEFYNLDRIYVKSANGVPTMDG
ncbi:MAG: hypothetical protein JO271_10440 [Verrucomicrobia bacterium]|nr:hypothetical protein [Verrucomicrobiota bacterium]